MASPRVFKFEEISGNSFYMFRTLEHSLGVRGVGSSNLPVPTNTTTALFRDVQAGCSIAHRGPA
jgi:hypothetical protein